MDLYKCLSVLSLILPSEGKYLNPLTVFPLVSNNLRDYVTIILGRGCFIFGE